MQLFTSGLPSTLTDDGSGNLTFTGKWINTRNGAADAPANTMTGTWFTGGTTTTTKPHFLIEPAGTTSTAWSTSGTGFGVNAPSSFTGNLFDLQSNGVSQASITSAGHVQLRSNCRFLITGAPAITVVWGSTSFVLASNYGLSWSTNNNDATSPPATTLIPDQANILAQRNATAAQSFRVYNTYTSATNFERLNIRWTSNEAIIDTEAGSGGGTLRGLKIGSASTSLLGFYGATPVARGAAVADATDAASVITQLNALLARVRAVGLIAT